MSKNKINFSAQHLLINKRLVGELIEMAQISRKDTVLDIGAGVGAITFPLSEKAGTVVAIENDSAYISKLLRKTEGKKNIRVKSIDFLQYNLPKGSFSVVANIPYSITTPIFGKLLDHPNSGLQRAVIIIEKGAAKRFTAVPTANPRILKWRMWYDIRLVRAVSPSHFSPLPSVDSAILLVTRKQRPLVSPNHHAKFMGLAAYGLQFPQMPFFAALAGIFTAPQITRLVRLLSVDRNQPIGSLSEQQWGELFLAMLQHVDPVRWPRVPKRKKQRR